MGRNGSFAPLTAPFTAPFTGAFTDAFADAFGVPFVDAVAVSFTPALETDFDTGFSADFDTGFDTGFDADLDAVFALAVPVLTGLAGAPFTALVPGAAFATFALAEAGFFAAFNFVACGAPLRGAAFFGAETLPFLAEWLTLLVRLRDLVRLESGSLMVSLQEAVSWTSSSLCFRSVFARTLPCLCYIFALIF